MTDPENFLEKLQSFHKAIEEEFNAIENQDLTTIREVLKKKFIASLPELADEVVRIAKGGDTDTGKMKAITFAFEYVFGKDGKDKDSLGALLDQLTKTSE